MKRFMATVASLAFLPALAFAQARGGPFGDAKVSAASDAEILAVLKENKIAPARMSSDSELVRRVYLDLLGRIPTAEETTAYLDDKAPDKHRRLVESLLSHWEMPSAWSDVLHVWLNGRSPEPGFGYKEFREYLRSSLAGNKPWDRICRELLLPESTARSSRPPFSWGHVLPATTKKINSTA